MDTKSRRTPASGISTPDELDFAIAFPNQDVEISLYGYNLLSHFPCHDHCWLIVNRVGGFEIDISLQLVKLAAQYLYL